MTSKSLVDEFVSQKTLAVVGVSRQGQKFGNIAYRELRSKGYTVFPVHPQAETLEGDRAYKDLASLPGEVGGVLIAVPPARVLEVLEQVKTAGIRRVWMQQGAESPQAIEFCRENGIAAVHGECIMMYAVNTGIHRFHGWVWKLFGKAPA